MVAQKPTTKFGQLQQRWPEIKAALRAGHRIQQVRAALSEDGLDLSYSKLRSYVARLKRLEASGADIPREQPNREGGSQDSRPAASAARRDPLSNLRDRMNRKSGFEFDEHPPDEKKLI
jgi:hypothetical protein